MLEEHPKIEELEDYAFDEMEESRLKQLEEHLLVCEFCRERVTEIDRDIAVSFKIEQEEKSALDPEVKNGRKSTDGKE